MPRESTPTLKIGRWRVAVQFKAADLWIGVFWANHHGLVDVWICVVPCLPIHIWNM